MNLVERVKNILLQPKQEWPVIAGENTATADLYKSYIAPLAAIPALAGFVGLSLVGISLAFLGGTYRVPIGSGLAYAIINFLLTLGAVYVLALIINAMAPNFGGEKNMQQALKLVAYSSTASWLAGIFAIVPQLSILSLLGLYSLYLLYLGLPVLMKCPADKAMGYTIMLVICAIGIFLVVGFISSAFITYPAPNFTGVQ
ncbi:MAG: Yip1 family protein [Gammaproteobacteria bacterium]